MRALLVSLIVVLAPQIASAQSAFEVNALWPFFPGGLVDLKIVTPLATTDSPWRGELITGLHSDFGWRFVRDEDAGRVAFLGAKTGYRQFLGSGLHVDTTVNAGWRHEVRAHPLVPGSVVDVRRLPVGRHTPHLREWTRRGGTASLPNRPLCGPRKTARGGRRFERWISLPVSACLTSRSPVRRCCRAQVRHRPTNEPDRTRATSQFRTLR